MCGAPRSPLAPRPRGCYEVRLSLEVTVSLIADGKVVSLSYLLKNDAGDVLDRSDDEPLLYLHGAGNIVPGLERKLGGRKVGDKLEVVVDPADGYGEREPGATHEVPRSAFPEDAPLEAGVSFLIESSDGETVPMWITGVAGDTVTIDGNHPLAGVRLHFAVEVQAVRDATDEEKEHGHPHEPGGHHHH
ncbi:MAG: peptidylprolyl isomerase [Myxococcales bacterium]|nr:peptidylprolyl isomerase [Myxococcales bacterium]